MCLSVPGEVLSIEGDHAVVSLGGARVKAGLQLVEGVAVGDFVLVHSGFAIQKVDKAEAAETLKLFREISGIK